MKVKMIKGVLPTSLLWMTLLAMALALSTLAEAGRGHHRHHHHGHHHHHGGYALIYNQPYGYYNWPYNVRPGYGYNYYPAPVPVYAPPPVYTYPPNVMMDINTGYGHFFFSY